MGKALKKSFVPVDDAERKRLISDHSRDYVAIAGAGTGKTTILTERVIETIRDRKVRPENLFIATFTEKAAAEMQERLLDKLAGVGDEELLRSMEENPAGTFHARAKALLETFAVEAGLPPGFTVLDQDMEDSLHAEVFRAFVARILEEGGEEAETLAVLSSLGMNAGRVEDGAREYSRLRTRCCVGTTEDAIGEWKEAGELKEMLEGVIAGAREAVEAVLVNPENKKWVRSAGELKTALEFLESGSLKKILDGDVTLEDYARIVERTNTVWGNGNNMRGKAREPEALRSAFGKGDGAREELSGLRGFLVLLQERALVPFAKRMAGLFERYHAECSEEKRRRAALTFDDLLVRMRDLLRNNEAVRSAAGKRFAQVFVDEFQDTDPIQLEIVELMAYGKKPLEKRNKLFLAGDPRQSIYHFRNADLRVYDEVRRRTVESGGEEVNLRQSFRAVPPVPDFVNALYKKWRERPPYGEAAGYSKTLSYDLAAAREPMSGSGVEVLVPKGGAEGKMLSYEALRSEAAVVAEYLRRLKDEGLKVYDRDAEEKRPFRWGDAAILLQRMTHARLYEEALEAAGVPCVMEGARTFFTKVEVRSLGALLRAALYPADKAAVMGALSSPVLSVPAGDVLRACSAGWGLSLNEDLPTEAGESLKRAVEYLKRFVPLVPQGLTRVAEAYLNRGGLMAVFVAADPTGARTWALSAFAELIRREEAAGKSADEIADQLLSPEGADIELPSAAGIDAVHIMTVHKAKGLEWPVVVVADLLYEPGKGRSYGVTKYASPDGRFGIAVSVDTPGRTSDEGKPSLVTPLWREFKEEESSYEHEEWLRRMYVAFTRARDRLVIAAHAPLNRKPSQMVSTAIEDILDTARRVDGARVVEMDAPEAKQVVARTIGETAVIVKALRDVPPPAYDMESNREENASDEADWRAARLGEAFHEVAAEWFRTLKRPDVSGRVPLDVDAGRVEELLDNIDRLGLVERASKAETRLVEWPLAGRGGGELRADLLLLENGRWVVVEFKTDKVAHGETDSVAGRYKGQVEGYVQALRDGGLAAGEAILVLADIPKEVVVSG